MTSTKYYGKPCRHDHHQENGKTLRYSRDNGCVACSAERVAKHRNKGEVRSQSIELPVRMVEHIERAADALGISKAEFYRRAVRNALSGGLRR